MATTKSGGKKIVSVSSSFLFICFQRAEHQYEQQRVYRNDPNVLLLHYADVRKDLKGSVENVANFLNVQLTADELAVGTSSGMP